MILKKLTLLLAASISSGIAEDKTHPVNPDLELIITSPRVVNSPLASYPGSFSFGRLMERSYGKERAPSVVRSWILSYTTRTKVAGQIIPSRENAFKKIVQPWLKKDGFTSDNILDWKPNLANAPLKLLAIVNRQDIAVARTIGPASDLFTQSPPSPLLDAPLSDEEKSRVEIGRASGPGGYYGSTSSGAGEIRFIYCLTDKNGIPLENGMTVILEHDQLNLYTTNHPESRSIAKTPSTKRGTFSTESTHYIATRWHALGRHNELNEDYLKELDLLVKQATTPIHNEKSFPTIIDMIAASPLLRVRTNDNALGKGREFRQFDSTGKTVMPSLLSASLADAFCDPKTPESRALGEYIARENQLPLEIEVEGKMVKLSTASSMTLPEKKEKTAWNIKYISKENRRHISMNSCIGCHGKETESDGFHIAPPSSNLLPTLISGFLSDTSNRTAIRDPHSKRRYSQPGELTRRTRIHEALISPKILNPKRFLKLAADAKNTAH